MTQKEISEKDRIYDIKIERFLAEQEELTNSIKRKAYEWLWSIVYFDIKRSDEQKERALNIMLTRKMR